MTAQEKRYALYALSLALASGPVWVGCTYAYFWAINKL